jgi:hypothetical protein
MRRCDSLLRRGGGQKFFGPFFFKKELLAFF